MLQCAPDAFGRFVVDRFNEMLQTGNIEPSWARTLFTMLPKQGDQNQVGNLRPIAILKITYKLFARMIYQRLHTTLEIIKAVIRLESAPNIQSKMHLLSWKQ